MVITIDGTSASGKTTAARELARRLDFALLRTGAMYRALALAAHRAGFDERAGARELSPLLDQWQIDADESHVYLNGQEISREIDGDRMSCLSSAWAELPVVREHINKSIQRRADQYRTAGRSFVAEGRDQGSYVFPGAECKFYIDAELAVRAFRRMKDLHHREDRSKTQEQLMQELDQRDQRDRQRALAPLCVPKGALVIDSTHLTKEAVVDQLFEAVQAYRGRAG